MIVTNFRELGDLAAASTQSSSYYTPWGPDVPVAVAPAEESWGIETVREAILAIPLQGSKWEKYKY